MMQMANLYIYDIVVSPAVEIRRHTAETPRGRTEQSRQDIGQSSQRDREIHPSSIVSKVNGSVVTPGWIAY